MNAPKSKIQYNYWLIFLPRNASESTVSLALFFIVTIRTCNITEGMQNSPMIWLLRAWWQLGGRMSHSYRSVEFTREPMAFRIWGKDLSLNRFYWIQDTYYIPQPHQCRSQVCCGRAPDGNSSWYTWWDLVQFWKLGPSSICRAHSIFPLHYLHWSPPVKSSGVAAIIQIWVKQAWSFLGPLNIEGIQITDREGKEWWLLF